MTGGDRQVGRPKGAIVKWAIGCKISNDNEEDERTKVQGKPFSYENVAKAQHAHSNLPQLNVIKDMQV